VISSIAPSLRLPLPAVVREEHLAALTTRRTFFGRHGLPGARVALSPPAPAVASAALTSGLVRESGTHGGGCLKVVHDDRHVEHLLPERPRFGPLPGCIERGGELEGGAVVRRVSGEHLPKLGGGGGGVMLRVKGVEPCRMSASSLGTSGAASRARALSAVSVSA
jgi:hypothetical protein